MSRRRRKPPSAPAPVAEDRPLSFKAWVQQRPNAGVTRVDLWNAQMNVIKAAEAGMGPLQRRIDQLERQLAALIEVLEPTGLPLGGTEGVDPMFTPSPEFLAAAYPRPIGGELLEAVKDAADPDDDLPEKVPAEPEPEPTPEGPFQFVDRRKR